MSHSKNDSEKWRFSLRYLFVATGAISVILAAWYHLGIGGVVATGDLGELHLAGTNISDEGFRRLKYALPTAYIYR